MFNLSTAGELLRRRITRVTALTVMAGLWHSMDKEPNVDEYVRRDRSRFAWIMSPSSAGGSSLRSSLAGTSEAWNASEVVCKLILPDVHLHPQASIWGYLRLVMDPCRDGPNRPAMPLTQRNQIIGCLWRSDKFSAINGTKSQHLYQVKSFGNVCGPPTVEPAVWFNVAHGLDRSCILNRHL